MSIILQLYVYWKHMHGGCLFMVFSSRTQLCKHNFWGAYKLSMLSSQVGIYKPDPDPFVFFQTYILLYRKKTHLYNSIMCMHSLIRIQVKKMRGSVKLSWKGTQRETIALEYIILIIDPYVNKVQQIWNTQHVCKPETLYTLL